MNIEILHLIFNCPNRYGSVNGLIKQQMISLSQFSQLAIVGSNKEECTCVSEEPVNIIHVEKGDTNLFERLLVNIPYRIRKNFQCVPIQNCERLLFYYAAIKKIKEIKPSIVVVYDDYKMLYNLKSSVNWPCRVIFSQHGFSYHLCPQEASKIYSYDTIDLVHVLSRSSYQFDRFTISSYEPEVVVIPNGVDVYRFCPVDCEKKNILRDKLGIPRDKKIFLLLSRIVAKKGIHIILSIWKEFSQLHPDAYLWIIGNGDVKYESEINQMITGLHQVNIKVDKRIDHNLIHECYQASDSYILPTLNTEGLGLTVLEAMACGLPCIVSNYPAAQELFLKSEVIFANTPNIPEDYLPLMELVLKGGEYIDLMRFNARNAVLQRFSLDRWLIKWAIVYEQQLRLVSLMK